MCSVMLNVGNKSLCLMIMTYRTTSTYKEATYETFAIPLIIWVQFQSGAQKLQR